MYFNRWIRYEVHKKEKKREKPHFSYHRVSANACSKWKDFIFDTIDKETMFKSIQLKYPRT